MSESYFNIHGSTTQCVVSDNELYSDNLRIDTGLNLHIKLTAKA
jgi:hypothetical protein